MREARRPAARGSAEPLRCLSPREASIFACVCDTVVAPEPVLPPVCETDAVASFDCLLAQSPRLNRIGLRALLYAAELAPRALRMRRLRALRSGERGAALERLESMPRAARLVELVEGLACLAYYGDEAVMRRLGYDAGARIARGRELRAREGRP